MFYEDPTFWINIGFVLVGVAYGIYYYVKQKKLTPLFKLASLLLECLKDGVITKDEWTKIHEAIAEILQAEVREVVIDPVPLATALNAVVTEHANEGSPLAQRVKDELDL